MPSDKDAPCAEVLDAIYASMANTHAEAHKNLKVTVRHVFEIEKPSEKLSYSPFEKNLHNKFLLWHGCRSTSLAANLREGLKLPSKESADTGLMFGKGIYLTDCFSKAAN